MIGLLYFLFFGIYLWLSVKVVRFAARWAKTHGRSPRLWGFLAGLAMYSLIFWDLIPAFALWGYECATRAGFTQYKTLEQWKRENPGVAETLVPELKPPWQKQGNRQRVPLNQRFAWDTITTWHPFHIREREERIVDVKTGEVLARYVDFDTDIAALGSGTRNLRDYKFWLMRRSCECPELPQQIQFNGYQYGIEMMGKKK